MKTIVYNGASGFPLETILSPVIRSGAKMITTCMTVFDFVEAVRTNTESRPVIVFCAEDVASLSHLRAIKKYLSDAFLFLIVPDERTCRAALAEFSLFIRHIHYRDDNPYILAAMLRKLAQQNSFCAGGKRAGHMTAQSPQ